uniref:Uncharacterized protein n=1 Tax=Peronospora matthiolae TaxID=2874970 RepID=A0AAV1T558_9STRA
MQLRTQYLLLLVVFCVIARGMVKSSFGSNMCVLLLVCVAMYYYCTKQNEQCVYDEIARQQAESIAKMDALRGMGDGKVTDYTLAMRRTSFKLDNIDAGVITERIRGYSSKFGGSRKDRQKFLRKNSKTKRGDVGVEDLALAALTKSLLVSEPSESEIKHNIGAIVEEAVDATL